MFMTETWLDENTGNAVLIEASPPNFKFESEIRENKKVGGIAAIFRDHFGKFSSFECVF